MPANLLPQDAKQAAQKSKLKRTAYLITTVVLVAYLVLVASLGGWWLFLSTRQVQLTDEVVALSAQVQQKADIEAAIRHQAVRVEEIDKFLNTRTSFAKTADILLANSTNTNVTGWIYALSGKHLLNLQASDAASLETYVNGLKTSFTDIEIENVTRKSATDWEAGVNLLGKKQ
jgi:hypothetical protein